MDRHFLNVDGPDIVVRRQMDPYAKPGTHEYAHGQVQVNVPRSVYVHDREGFAIGERAAGTYDLALCILQKFLPGQDIEGMDRTRGSRHAFLLHQTFAEDLLWMAQPEPGASGVDGCKEYHFSCQQIKAWIRSETRMIPPHRRSFLIAELNGFVEVADVQTSDGGSLKTVFLMGRPDGKEITFGSAEGVSISFHSLEQDMPFVHKDFSALLGKRLKITIEGVVDEYNG